MNVRHLATPKRARVVWTFPDPVPLHREPLYTNRRDLVADYPTYEDRKFYRLPTMYASIQKRTFSKEYPMILTSGRLVEYEGGGDETAQTLGWLNCSRTCSLKSTLGMPTISGCETAHRSGSKVRKAQKSR